MRKVICIVSCVLFLLLVGYANAQMKDEEIAFQNISWLSDENATLKGLINSGFVREGIETLIFSQDGTTYIVPEEVVNFRVESNSSKNKDVCVAASLEGFAKGKIAGFPIDNLELTFAYDGNFYLIAVKVELIGSDYQILQNKLVKVYGEGEHEAVVEEEIESHIWKGANDSAVLLYTEDGGVHYTLIYGRLDAEEILVKCHEIDFDDVSGL